METSENIADILTCPAVLKGQLENWPARHWSPEYLATVLKEKKLKIRIAPHSAANSTCALWETDCVYEDATLKQFCQWLNKATPADIDNPLHKYSQDEYWCYVDYKQMAFLFEEHPEILKAVDWSDFGCGDRDGSQSTIWIGSQGACTPGHYDTYGFNLVAQIFGRKRWHLFPPSQTQSLYPTRLPYEESSVFSPVNITNPCLQRYPMLANATPYVITLEPGDVLFVPKRWWHFVESLEVSISVNTWIEVESDRESRMEEAVTRAIVSSVMAGHSDTRNWVNPTETICSEKMNYRFLKLTLEDFFCGPSSTSRTCREESPPESDCQTDEGNPVRMKTEKDPHLQTSRFSESPPKHPQWSQDQESKQGSSSHRPGYDELASSADKAAGISPKCLKVKRPAADVSRTITPSKLLKGDPCQSDTGASEEGSSKSTVSVPCLGQIYRNVHSTGPSRSDEQSDADLKMKLRSKVNDLSTDDLRRMLVECATHPSVVSLMINLLKEKFDPRI